ncbi:uncharacterized protein [Physcomitrium patens]|uniref:uncharacterized protein isoform X2 n=1 Tax=Physcomitrium patens TaxID=3218 RepID=UPI003CCCFDFC
MGSSIISISSFMKMSPSGRNLYSEISRMGGFQNVLRLSTRVLYCLLFINVRSFSSMTLSWQLSFSKDCYNLSLSRRPVLRKFQEYASEADVTTIFLTGSLFTSRFPPPLVHLRLNIGTFVSK